MVFTCVTCGVAFLEAQSQRLHFKTEWHRYNLKRKVAELPPIDDVSFQDRLVLQQKLLSPQGDVSVLRRRAGADADKVDVHQRYCNYCRKSFASRNAFDNHLNSKRHMDAAKKRTEQPTKTLGLGKEQMTKSDVKQAMKDEKVVVLNDLDVGDDDEWSDVDDEDNDGDDGLDGEPLALEECTFCSHLSDSLESNMQHMTSDHSFFVPDANYLADLEGLIRYLAEKVGVGYMCLWCNERGRAFRSAVAAQQHMRDKGHCKLMFEGNEGIEEYADFYDYSSSYPEEDGAEEHNVSRDPDEEVSVDTLDDGGYELVLPSGAIIGHRSLMRYYRQSLPPERSQTRGNRALSAVVAHYRGLGWIGMTGQGARQKARAIGLMHMRRSKHYMQLGVKSNKLQKHFREQVLF